MPACPLGCQCAKHSTPVERLRQQQLDTAKLSDDMLTSKQLRQRQQQRRHRAAKGSSGRGSGNHMVMPSDLFDWERAITGFRKILAEMYDDE